MSSSPPVVPRLVIELGYYTHKLIATIDRLWFCGDLDSPFPSLIEDVVLDVDYACRRLGEEGIDIDIRQGTETVKQATDRFLDFLKRDWQGPNHQRLLAAQSDLQDALFGDEQPSPIREWQCRHSILAAQETNGFRRALREFCKSLPSDLGSCFRAGSCWAQVDNVHYADPSLYGRLSAFGDTYPLQDLQDWLRRLKVDFPVLADLDVELRSHVADDRHAVDGWHIDKAGVLLNQILARFSESKPTSGLTAATVESPSAPSAAARANSTATASASMKQPKPSEEKAYSHWKTAVRTVSSLAGATDREIYDWIAEYMLDEDETLPAFSTWTRQLRAARSFHGDRKNNPRGTRAAGKSIVGQHEI